MKVSVIVVVDENFAIGYKNGLLCHLPADLKHFKSLTTGKTIIMGRKTFESLPNGALPNRENIVLTRDNSIKFDNAVAFSNLNDALEYCKEKEEVFIIGGGMLYNESLNLADTLYLTCINHKFENADTYFPSINFEEWDIVENNEFEPDDRNKFHYSFKTLKRKSTVI